jgi:hypothetical protein
MSNKMMDKSSFHRWKLKNNFLRKFFRILIVLLLFTNYSHSATNIESDIVIFESTPAGIVAAIAAANDGHRVVMVTVHKHIGGMRTSGLSMPNLPIRETFGGLGKEFHNRVYKYYISTYGIDSEQVKDCDEGFMFEPHVAEEVFLNWLLDSGVEILSEERVISVQKKGTKILSVQTDRNRQIKARVFIDASYEGDLMAMAGASYRIGREGKEEYGETYAGMTFPPDKAGQPSEKIQRFVYRLVLTDSIENQIPIRKPENYHRASFMIDAAQFEHTPPSSLKKVLSLNRVPNRKTDVRVGEGWLGGSHEWPEATFSEREIIAQEHRDYAEGYLWFLLTDKSVPLNVSRELRRWGYAKDEFIDNDNWPYQLYVREARRLVGEFVMTEHDILKNRFKSDAVAIGSYMLDVHPVQYVPFPDKMRGLYSHSSVAREGGVAQQIKPYEISFKTMLPKREEISNLLVAVCISSSHIAYSTIRMEPVYMMLGHAAGLAASMSLDNGIEVHEISADDLRNRLVKQEAVIDAGSF